MSKHTPGPWMVDIVKNGGHWTYDIRTVAPHNPAGTIGKHIATANPLMQARGEDNAALLAAAPELLAACQAYNSAYSFISENPPHHALRDAVMKVRAAIAKAGGVA